MPYNTRRKSLSLPSLGIQLPNSTRTHRSNSKTNPSDQVATDASPPAKRVKREHQSPSPLPSPRRTPSSDLAANKSEQMPPQPRVNAHTPPPSPGDVVNVTYRKIDLDGIKDDVVISCIEQLEKTGNRPHLIKELATVLLSTNRNIANSANPAALLSSRLTQYMKRPWTALSPCPIAKELIPVHPRKVFFFLTTQPRGELPTNSDDILPPVLADLKRLTPSISDPSVIDDEAELEHRERMRFSPSPEVELFSPELRAVGAAIPVRQPSFEDQIGSLHSIPEIPVPVAHSHHSRQRSHHDAPSLGLEADEQGFTETAAVVRQSRLMDQTAQLTISVQEAEEQKPRSDAEVRMELFGRSHAGLGVEPNKQHMMSSPMMVPKPNLTLQRIDVDIDMDIDMEDANWNIKSPEATSFDELDEMFDDF